MEISSIYSEKFQFLKCCVLIPTYNNQATLSRVIEGVQEYTNNIIVINDGSTDATASMLKDYPEITTVHYSRNRGKGYALRTGFRKAEELGYDYAVSIDSDGQHYPDDLPSFLKVLEERKGQDPEVLVIGSRRMDHSSVPGKSSLGNRLSSFWVWVETGTRLQDTQCGYRLYPLKTVNSLHLFTHRYELEIEVLVKAAWAGVRLVNLPVKVLYDPSERVTHFRPFQDVFRITLLNTYFVIYGIFVIAPRALYRRFLKNQKQQEPKYSSSQVPVESEG